MGPVEVLIVSFPSLGLVSSIGVHLKALTETGLVRVVDAIVVEGCDEMVITDLDDSVIPGWSTICPRPRPLLSAADGSWAAERHAAGEASVVLVLEHTWPGRLARQVSESGGGVHLLARIAPDTVDAALRVVA